MIEQDRIPMRRILPETNHALVILLCITAALFLQSVGWELFAQESPRKFRLPDTGQTSHLSQMPGDDADYTLNPPFFHDNGDGTVTDSVTGLMWQRVDGGEMTFENAKTYCINLTLGEFHDWRLPTCHELFSILNHSRLNPAVDTIYFPVTQAEYWWSCDRQVNDTVKIWVTNAGGGIGPHPRNETISAGGTRRFHVRAVRDVNTRIIGDQHFFDNQDGTLSDRFTGLMWQKVISPDTLSWDNAIGYAENLALAGYADWRLPNVKELQSINDERLRQPSLDTNYFSAPRFGNYWSSTTLIGNTVRAWLVDFVYGITTYDDKVRRLSVVCVRGISDAPYRTPSMAFLHSGEYAMGDHFGFVDPGHPSDEIPIHTVHVDSVFIGTCELTNQQYCDYLNSAMTQGLITVQNGVVRGVNDTTTYFFTHVFADYSSIQWDGTSFSIADFRDHHPVVGVMWSGAAAYCNWLSTQQDLQACYDLSTWTCDFTQNGYRLPTEAEWEYAGRGGQYNPYFIFPWGDDSTTFSRANWPNSGDPYEAGAYPLTTPVGFYDGRRQDRYEFAWPGAQNLYQTANGANAFGLFDMAGNVWEFVNDWYATNYYSESPVDNPTGPVSGTVMPDGRPYRGMRGGNWYNGQWGHSRVSNRDPSYFRGPQDPNHPWYHIGFRVARRGNVANSHIQHDAVPNRFRLYQNYPNPFNSSTTIVFEIPRASRVRLKVFNILGEEVATLMDGVVNAGVHEVIFNQQNLSSGVYFCRLTANQQSLMIKAMLLK
jgi:formylglycine-generating enzyme required for sulfatase activity